MNEHFVIKHVWRLKWLTAFRADLVLNGREGIVDSELFVEPLVTTPQQTDVGYLVKLHRQTI